MLCIALVKFHSITNNIGTVVKGMQPGAVLWEMLTELFVRSYFQQNEVLIYFFLIFIINSSIDRNINPVSSIKYQCGGIQI
jgi:hypothetical protein